MSENDKNKSKNSVDGLISSKNDLAGSRKIVLDSIGEGTVDLKSKPLEDVAPKKKNDQKPLEPSVLKKDKFFAKKISNNNIDGIKFLDSFNLLEKEILEKADKSEKSTDFEMDPEIIEKMGKNEINPTLINDINKRGISFDDLADFSKSNNSELIDSNHEKKRNTFGKKRKLKKTSLVAKKELVPETKLKIKQKSKPKKPIDWKKKFSFLFKIMAVLGNFRRNFRQYLSRAAFYALFFLLLFLFVYLAYATTILKFEVDNRFSRFLGKYAFVPAYVSAEHVLDFFLWQDIKNYAESEGKETPRKALARFLALKELSGRHNIFFPGFTMIYNQGFLEEIEQKTIMDKRFNPVALNRIEGVSNMIKNKEDFIRVSEKHGDDLGRVTINDENQDQYPQEIKNLASGEISGIIGTADGYYIYKCFEVNESERSLSYVFVGSGNFEDKLSELMTSYRLISLVD